MKNHPYWWDTVPSAVAGLQSPVIPSTADVAIVGAGYTGLSAARRLALAGASVVVIERERIGWGASSRNGGQVLTGLRLDPTTLVARYGERDARRLFEAGNEAIAGLESLIGAEAIDCEYERTGHIQAAWKPTHFAAMREEQALLARVFDHHVELVPREAQRGELGSDAYFGLLVDDRSGALNPARYVAGLAAAASRAGARLVCGRPVTALARANQRWRVAVGGGEGEAMVAADVLVATDGYTDRLLPPLQRRLVPIGSYAIATAPLRDDQAREILPRRRMAFDSKHFLYYFRLTSDQRLLFGGRAEFSSPTAASTQRAAEVLRRGVEHVFPQLRGVEIEYAWGGNVAFTRDEMPHAIRLDGVYAAGGYCGHGIAIATALGDLVGRRLAGEALAHPLLDTPFPSIPLYRGTPWFLPLVGAYYRVKDWLQ